VRKKEQNRWKKEGEVGEEGMRIKAKHKKKKNARTSRKREEGN
jgi:hypothetical protein